MRHDLTSETGVMDWLSAHVQPCVGVQRINDGLVNYVWRVALDDGRSAIVKHAAPTMASAPEIALTQERLALEHAALVSFGGDFIPPEIPAFLPEVYAFSHDDFALVMQDMAPSFGPMGPHVANAAGCYISHLHTSTRDNPEFAKTFDNRAIQQVRLVSQYQQIRHWLAAIDDSNADEIGQIAEGFGESLLDPGECIVMGDLWPNALLGRGTDVAVIDWEFVHYGRIGQDIGHLAAHCILQWEGVSKPFTIADDPIERLPWETPGGYWTGKIFWETFKIAYQKNNDEWDAEHARESSIHAGCEILSRTIGPLSNLYSAYGIDEVLANNLDGLSFYVHEILMPMVETAKAYILGDRSIDDL